MIYSVHWSCFYAFCLLFNQVGGLCTDQYIQIEGGNYSLSNQFKEGSILTYQCEEGFYPYPSMARVCNHDDMWEPSHSRSQCIQVVCPDPKVIENCTVLPSKPQYTYQSQITYECQKGYELYGPSHRTCLSNGKWSGSHPVCRRDSPDVCTDPGVPPGGSRTLSSFDTGGKMMYMCHGNKFLIGSEERVCQEDGFWSGIEPTCYYEYTFDSPREVAQVFNSVIQNKLAHLQLERDTKQPDRQITLVRNDKLNVYIAVDLSSISQQQFENAKKAVITLISKFAAFSVETNYEIIFFSSELTEVSDILSFFDDKSRLPLYQLTEHLKEYSFERKRQPESNLNVVFMRFLEKIAIIKHIKNNFNEYRHVILLFTDGRYNSGGTPIHTVERIKSLVLMDQPKHREEHLDIFIVGVGAQIYDDSLNGLTAGPGYRHYFRLKDYEQLSEAFDEMINEDVTELCGLHRDDEDMYDQRTRRSKYPWAMSVIVQTFSGLRSFCLGSLVSPRFVLTAAHCFTFDARQTTVEVNHGRQLDVKRVHIHPEFNVSAKLHLGIKEFYDYDVALVELGEDVTISASLNPICLPCTVGTNSALKQTFTCKEQEKLMLRNFERINFLTRNLIEKDALIKLGENRSDCIRKALHAPGITTNNASMVVTENFLCSGGTTPRVDKMACRGDGGGAVFKNYHRRTIQVAVVSWGNKLVADCYRGGVPLSDDDSRDFHINLFKVVPFLKSVLGRMDAYYSPLTFVD